MRWRFLDDGPDLLARDAKIADIESWWTAFSALADDLERLFTGQGDFDVVDFMGRELAKVDARLQWEFGPDHERSGHRLVVTPEHHYELSELVSTLTARAPTMPHWSFYDRRPALPFNDTAAMVTSRTGGSLDGVTVGLSEGESRLVDLKFTSTSESAQHDALVATEALLGEAALNDWVGEVVAAKPKRFGRSPATSPVAELPAVFADARRRLHAVTPPQPYHERVSDAEWTLFRLEPKEASDYPRTSDLMVAAAADTDLWTGSHSGRRFASERFSRSGERFVTVKLDGADGLEGSEFGDRSEIEDALGAVLHRPVSGVWSEVERACGTPMSTSAWPTWTPGSPQLAPVCEPAGFRNAPGFSSSITCGSMSGWGSIPKRHRRPAADRQSDRSPGG